jgi:hypothetical protein
MKAPDVSVPIFLLLLAAVLLNVHVVQCRRLDGSHSSFGKNRQPLLSPLSHTSPNSRALRGYSASATLHNLLSRHQDLAHDADTASVFNPAHPLVQRALDLPEYPPELDLALAKKLAYFTSASYCNATTILTWNCTRCLQVPDFQPYRVVFDPIWDLQAYVGYVPSFKAVVVAFRGTDSSSWYNWAENMRYWRSDTLYPVPNAPKAKVHTGFMMLWNASSLGATVTTAVGEVLEAHPGSQLFVTGHSMGGALAQLCALDMKFLYNVDQVRVYTFGSPRIGNQVFADFFQEWMTESWRFTHARDIVPSVPVQMMGFHHVSREVWLVDVPDASGQVQQRVVVCDASGEDPTCHNSVCYMGLCTSLADHMEYLQVQMYHDDSEC